jgi:hypothetical protein
MAIMSLLIDRIGKIGYLTQPETEKSEPSLDELENIARQCTDMFEFRRFRQEYLSGLREKGRKTEVYSLNSLARMSVLNNLISEARTIAEYDIGIFAFNSAEEIRGIVGKYRARALRLARKLGIPEAEIYEKFERIRGLIEED